VRLQRTTICPQEILRRENDGTLYNIRAVLWRDWPRGRLGTCRAFFVVSRSQPGSGHIRSIFLDERRGAFFAASCCGAGAQPTALWTTRRFVHQKHIGWQWKMRFSSSCHGILTWELAVVNYLRRRRLCVCRNFCTGDMGLLLVWGFLLRLSVVSFSWRVCNAYCHVFSCLPSVIWHCRPLLAVQSKIPRQLYLIASVFKMLKLVRMIFTYVSATLSKTYPLTLVTLKGTN